MTLPMVVIDHVAKAFGEVKVLHDICLTVEAGQVLCLIGPSGSGKSTLLRCINHLEKIQGGAIFVDGSMIGYRRVASHAYELPEWAIARQRAQIGMVFQDFNLFSHLTALQNVTEAPIQVLGANKREAADTARSLLERVGLGDHVNAYPRMLSGGQQQRVAIARALAMKPKVMLLDEPTSALDPELVGEVLDVVRQLAEEGLTMIIVTHEISFAREVADRIAFMDRGQIIEVGTAAQVIDSPQKERTQTFLSRVRHRVETEPE